MLDRLTEGLSILTSGRRTAPLRHSTLRAALDWSFDLLNDTEKTVFGRLGVFFADFTRNSVVRVVSDERLNASTVVDALDSLIAKSLVVVHRADGRIAFCLPGLTRAYALEKFRCDPFACEVYGRHVRYLYAPAETCGDKQCSNGPKPLASIRITAGESRAVACEGSWSASGPRTERM
jgi:predicted ATPase